MILSGLPMHAVIAPLPEQVVALVADVPFAELVSGGEPDGEALGASTAIGPDVWALAVPFPPVATVMETDRQALPEGESEGGIDAGDISLDAAERPAGRKPPNPPPGQLPVVAATLARSASDDEATGMEELQDGPATGPPRAESAGRDGYHLAVRADNRLSEEGWPRPAAAGSEVTRESVEVRAAAGIELRGFGVEGPRESPVPIRKDRDDATSPPDITVTVTTAVGGMSALPSADLEGHGAAPVKPADGMQPFAASGPSREAEGRPAVAKGVPHRGEAERVAIAAGADRPDPPTCGAVVAKPEGKVAAQTGGALLRLQAEPPALAGADHRHPGQAEPVDGERVEIAPGDKSRPDVPSFTVEAARPVQALPETEPGHRSLPQAELRPGEAKTLPPPLATAQVIVQAALAQPDGPVSLVLVPEDLGSLRFEMQGRGDAIHVNLTVEKPETLDMLRRHAEQLVSEFRQAGFSGASFSFSGAWGGGQERGTRQAYRASGEFPDEVPPPDKARRALSGLDLRL